MPRDEDDHVFTLHTYVAKTDEEARPQAKAAYDLYVDTRLYAKKHVYEDIIANGIYLFGSVETGRRGRCASCTKWASATSPRCTTSARWIRRWSSAR